MLLRSARNERVKSGLQEEYKEMLHKERLPQTTLPVFCVSSTEYEEGIERKRPELVEASEIPFLRQFCKSLSAEATLLDAKHFIGTQVASLLRSIEIWTSGSTEAIQSQSTVLSGIYEEFQLFEAMVIDTNSPPKLCN
jgi:hypothetical protein